jgi:hypothetical protein
MASGLPTEVQGDKVRKAVEEFCELLKQDKKKTRGELIEAVSRKYDLSPLECEFLLRQLKNC